MIIIDATYWVLLWLAAAAFLFFAGFITGVFSEIKPNLGVPDVLNGLRDKLKKDNDRP